AWVAVVGACAVAAVVVAAASVCVAVPVETTVCEAVVPVAAVTGDVVTSVDVVWAEETPAQTPRIVTKIAVVFLSMRQLRVPNSTLSKEKCSQARNCFSNPRSLNNNTHSD